MISWIIANREWLFSGVGVAGLSLLALLLRSGYSRWREDRPSENPRGLSRERVRKPTIQNRLPGFVLRALYKPGDVEPRIKVTLRSNAPGAVSVGGQLPCVDLYFEVTNLSPIDVILDRMLVDVWFGQPTFTAFVLHRYVVPSGEVTEGIHVKQLLADNQKAQIQAFNATTGIRSRLHIYVTAYFESKLGRFAVQATIERDNL